MKYLGNAFSLQMTDTTEKHTILTFPVKDADVSAILNDVKAGNITSCVGHQDLANILGVPFNRTSVALHEGDTLYVAQITSGRLPEGTTHLPTGVKICFLKVIVF